MPFNFSLCNNEQAEQLLLNILPKTVAQQMHQQQALLDGKKSVLIAQQFEEVTVLFGEIMKYFNLFFFV